MKKVSYSFSKKMKCISLAMVLALTLAIMPPITAFADEELPFEKANLQKAFADKAKRIQHENQELSVCSTKEIKDFAGRIYIVAECEPSGYMIYSTETGVFIEASPSAPSPYGGLQGDNLYYGGPTEYYEKVNGEYIHTVIDEKLVRAEEFEEMTMVSDNMAARLQENKDVALLDFVMNNNQTAYLSSRNAPQLRLFEGGLSPSAVNWFKNLNSCGYFEIPEKGDDVGFCGFIGLNMLYAYLDKFVSDKYMDNKYWADGQKSQLKKEDKSFSRYLYNLSPKDSTTSMHIHDVSRLYLEKMKINDIDHTSRWYPAFTDYTITAIIDNGYPVEVFGLFMYPSGQRSDEHAVVVYKYLKVPLNDISAICHFGWDDYTEIELSGLMGSIYAMEKI